MEQSWKYRLGGQAVVGAGAILFGGLLLLDNMGIIEADAYLRYWPLIIVALGIMKLAQSSSTGGWFWGLVLVLFGGLLTLHNLDIGTLGLRDFWPLLLILLGASLVVGGMGRRRAQSRGGLPQDTSTEENCFAVLGGTKRTNNSRDFRGGEMTAVMGGCEVDLRQADIGGTEAIIDIFAFWGGVKLQVPRSWRVVIQGLPFMGGFDDKTLQPTDQNAKRLIVKGTAIMGGVEITN
jgi:hypothetical protein